MLGAIISPETKATEIKYFKRYFGYTFWAGLEMAIFVGLPRLVIFPVVAYLLGKEEFGLFIWSLGIVMMLGKAPSGGLETGVIRHMAKLEEPAKHILVSTGLRLCKIAMLVIVAIGIVVLAMARYFWQADVKIIWCLVPLLIFLYSWNLFELQMVLYRVERRFALRLGWSSFLRALLFVALPAAIFGGVVGMAWGYVLGYVVTRIILSWRQGILFRKSIYDIKLAAVLKHAWFHLTVAGVFAFSSVYIYRVILGAFLPKQYVTILWGATSVIFLCVGPLNILSSLLLSMLGGFARLEDVGKRQRYTVLGAAILIAVVAPLAAFFAGPFILSVLFPEFANESAQVLRLIIMVIPCVVVTSFSRPFITKFGPIKFIPILNFITLVGHLLPALILIPRFGMKGVVISYNVGHGLTAVARLGALVWTFKFGSGSQFE
jgi:O-antigen/teichoic acid export membrane protein